MSAPALEMKEPAYSTSDDGCTIYQSLVIKAPIAKVYERAHRIEDLPAFIGFVRDVERISDARFVCTCVADGYETRVTVKLRSTLEPIGLTRSLRVVLNNFKRFVEREVGKNGFLLRA